MNTFDVFDTLIARRYISSNYIFLEIENKYSIPNFSQSRKTADTGQKNLLEIYTTLAEWGIIQFKEIEYYCTIEIEEEIKNTFAIKKNLNKVRHGDVLISDMYLPNWAILRILKSSGLDKEVTVYQSNGDKRTGLIWDVIKNYHDGVHLGDNLLSDVNQASVRKIKTQHTIDSELTNVEKILFNDNFKFLSLLSREVRLRSVGNHYSEISSNLNLVILFILSELLYRTYPDKNFIFLGRDCQLLEKIYSSYYKSSIYLPFSRRVAYSQPEVSIKYLNQYQIENSVFVDISSTGATWEYLGNSIPIVVAIYSDTYHYTKTKPQLTSTFKYIFSNSQIGSTNSVLELFNCGNHGHLSKIDLIGTKFFVSLFDQHELDSNIIHDIHEPINFAASLNTIYKLNLREELSQISTDVLKEMFKEFVQFLCLQKNLIDQSFIKKEEEYLNKVKNI